ncbi:MAG: alpha-D-ribose 1-methylphosphonate 5-triphosphate diphosphatase, partial [Pseudomonadota bacterium]
LASVEAELLANGITTAMLAQFWSWEGGMRGPKFARALAEALSAFAGAADIRMLLRLEIGCWQDFDEVEALIAKHHISHLVFSDHLPHEALAAGRKVPRLEGQALKAGRSPEAHLALMGKLHAGCDAADKEVAHLATQLATRQVAMGSHDDPNPEIRARYRDIGLRLAEFPMSLETAQAAREAGDRVVMGAPNVVRGGSHKRGGLSVRDALEAGTCDALASDYHYPAPLAAMRKLLADGWSLTRAWPLVSAGPAATLGLADRGFIGFGARADLVITSPGLKAVHGTIAGGRLAFADATLCDRLVA